ncbi:MAG: hypothetical protein ACXWCH_08730 [Burkholderiales bacterium]
MSAEMSTISETTLLDCPFSASLDYVEEFFNEHNRLPLKALRIIKTDVLMRYDLVADREDTARLHDALAVRWQPEGDLPLPTFHGSLSVRPHMRRTELHLEGGYLPPLGTTGKVFDAVVGRNVARDTMQGLLREIKTFVDSAWERDRSSYPDIEELNRRDR